MSLGSAFDVVSFDEQLQAAIASKDSKSAITLINTFIASGTDMRLLKSPRYAAKVGLVDVFHSLLSKGVDPFSPDKEGFSCFYFARIHAKQPIIDLMYSYFDKPFITDLSRKEGQDINYDIELALLDSGFHPFVIPEFDRQSDDLFQFLVQLLTPKAALPALVQKEKEKKKKEKDKEKKVETILISPMRLTQIAAGLLEEADPATILTYLNKLLPLLDWHQKLVCVFLVKELIRLDAHKQWILADAFQIAFNGFIEKLGNKERAMTRIRLKLSQFHGQHSQVSHLHSPLLLAYDLTTAFSDAILKITPEDFKSQRLFKEADKNVPFQNFSNLTNHLSHLVCLDVLLAKSPQDAASRVAFYLDVIDACLSEGILKQNPGLAVNVAAAASIVTGLQFNVIERIKPLWKFLSSQAMTKLKAYRELFSLYHNSANLRKYMALHPDCIPPLTTFCTDKEKIKSSPLFDRVLLNGAANQQFFEYQERLRRVEHLSRHDFLTDLQDKLQQVAKMSVADFDEFTYKKSYTLEPKVIELNKTVTPESLIRALKDTKAMKAPLVCSAQGQLAQAQAARQMIATFIASAPEKNDILTLCDEVMTTFNESGQVEYQDETTGELKALRAITEGIAEMQLEERSDSSSGTRNRSATVQFEDPPRRKISVEDRRVMMRKKATRADVQDPETERFSVLHTPRPSASDAAESSQHGFMPMLDSKRGHKKHKSLGVPSKSTLNKEAESKKEDKEERKAREYKKK